MDSSYINIVFCISFFCTSCICWHIWLQHIIPYTNYHVDIINIYKIPLIKFVCTYVINVYLHLPGECTYVKIIYCLIGNMYSFISYRNICCILHFRIGTFRFIHSAYNKQWKMISIKRRVTCKSTTPIKWTACWPLPTEQHLRALKLWTTGEKALTCQRC